MFLFVWFTIGSTPAASSRMSPHTAIVKDDPDAHAKEVVRLRKSYANRVHEDGKSGSATLQRYCTGTFSDDRPSIRTVSHS
ncbi:MAG: hypothetical protein ACKV2Q_04010 [Planctomycetaceae bacterium]